MPGWATGPMELREFQILKQKIETLIQSNHSLRQEKRAFTEKLLLREKQIRQLKERCEQYERKRREAYQRINANLSKIDGVKF
jgi:predicted  nucleic acid-binding Zn-ribbon protein